MPVTSTAHEAGVLSVLQHRNLLRELVTRDLKERYSGSMLGMTWSVITPILLILIYAVVFGAIFGSKIPGMDAKHSGTYGFGVYLYSGLLVFTIFSEVLTKAPALVYGNANYVKKVVFPLEILPVVTVISALVHSIIPFVVLLVATFFIVGSLPATALLYPFAVALMVPMILGIGWMVSALGAYVRDLGQAIALLVTVLMFLSPIFVPVANYPRWAQPIVRSNPVSVPIELGNALLFGSALPPLSTIAVYAVCSIIIFFAGRRIFEACRPGFPDVI
jgi:lipopolysaccharide transport system permease protein